MSNSPFATAGAPTGGDRVDLNDHIGGLLAIKALEYVPEVETSYGKAPAVRADLYVVEQDGVTDAEVYKDTLIFPKLLVSQTREKVGEIVVGRLGRTTTSNGHQAYLLSEDVSDDDRKACEAWYQRRTEAAGNPQAKAEPQAATVGTGTEIPF